jgi:peptide/nickel transport system substrate-binding protein
MRKLLLVSVMLLLAGILLLGSCAETTTTTTQPATTTTTTQATTRTTTTTQPTTQTTTTPPVTMPTGTIRIASAPEGSGFTYESVDPIVGESFWGFALYDLLVRLNDQGEAEGVVAESWTVSPDGKTWTFKIRKGIKFHNGDPLTAADVMFSVEHYKSEESTNPWSPYLRNNFASNSTPDDYTYQYVTNTVEPALILCFSYTRILPKNYYESVGKDAFRAAPIGSGPYKFVKFIPSTSFEMEANTDYWGGMPSYKTIIDLAVPEEATRVALIKSGEVDIAQSLTPDRLVELRNAGYTLQEAGLNSLSNISFPGTWDTDSPTKNIKVRQAMSYAINRQEMSDTFFNGLAKPGSRWFMDPASWGWDPAWKPDPYDVARAKALLAEANYPAAFDDPVIQLYGQTGMQTNILQMLQGYWNAAGIQTKLNTVDFQGYLGLFFFGKRAPTDPNMGAVIAWWYQNFLISVYHSANMYTAGGVHSTGNDPKADELFKKAASEPDLVKAEQYWTEFQNYAYDMWVNVGVLEMPTYIVVGPELGDFTSIKSLGIYYLLSGIKHPAK